MSIGVERVNGGVISGQWTEGSLDYFRITGPATAFAGSFGLTPTEKGPRPAPGSAAEAIYRIVSTFGTPVIFEIKSATQIDVAVAYGSSMLPVSGAAGRPQEAVRELGAAAVFKKFGGAAVTGDDDDLVDTAALDFSAATVAQGDFRVANI